MSAPALSFHSSSSDGPACADDGLQQGKDLFRVLARVEPLLDNCAPTKPERLRLAKIIQQGVNRLCKRVPIIDRQQPARSAILDNLWNPANRARDDRQTR